MRGLISISARLLLRGLRSTVPPARRRRRARRGAPPASFRSVSVPQGAGFPHAGARLAPTSALRRECTRRRERGACSRRADRQRAARQGERRSERRGQARARRPGRRPPRNAWPPDGVQPTRRPALAGEPTDRPRRRAGCAARHGCADARARRAGRRRGAATRRGLQRPGRVSRPELLSVRGTPRRPSRPRAAHESGYAQSQANRGRGRHPRRGFDRGTAAPPEGTVC